LVVAIGDSTLQRDVLPVIGEAAGGKLLHRALAVARKIEFSGDRAWALIKLASHLDHGEQDRTVREAADAALQWKSFNQLEALLKICPKPERTQVIAAMIDAVNDMHEQGERVAALLAISGYTGNKNERDRLVAMALDAAKELAHDYTSYMHLVSIAEHSDGLSPAERAQLNEQVLAIARAMPRDDWRVETLAKLIDYVDERDKESMLADVLQQFGKLSPFMRRFALKELAPRLPATMLSSAFRMAQVIEDDRLKRDAIAALSPYLLRSPKDDELKAAVAAAKDVEHRPTGRDILIALAPRVRGAQRALVLDAALDLIGAEQSIGKLGNGLAILAPSLNYARSAEVRSAWERAAQMAREIKDAAERAQALTALASNVDQDMRPPLAPGPYEILVDALRAARAIEGNYYLAKRAMALAMIGTNLPKGQRLRILDEASDTAWLVIRQIQEAGKDWDLRSDGTSIKALAEVAIRLESDGRHPMADVVAGFARNLSGNVIGRADVLATVATCYREPHRTNMLHEAVLIAREGLLPGERLAALTTVLPEAERVAVLLDALPEARERDGYNLWSNIVTGLQTLPDPSAYKTMRIHPSSLTNLKREYLLRELQHTAPLVAKLGGHSAIAEIVDAIGQVARWWP
jgi:hypothetical protein